MTTIKKANVHVLQIVNYPFESHEILVIGSYSNAKNVCSILTDASKERYCHYCNSLNVSLDYIESYHGDDRVYNSDGELATWQEIKQFFYKGVSK